MFKLFDLRSVTFNCGAVEEPIPGSAYSMLNSDQQKLEYRRVKNALNESIIDIAIQDEQAIEFAKILAGRILIILEIMADLGLDDRLSSPLVDLGRIGVHLQSNQTRPADFLKLLHRNNQIRIVMQTLGREATEFLGGDVKVEEGLVYEQGCVGMNPNAVYNIIKHGNLRELMYIAYKSIYTLDYYLLHSSEAVVKVNEILQTRGLAWQLNSLIINQFKIEFGKNTLFSYGAYAKAREGSQIVRDQQYRREYAARNPTVNEMKSKRIPLSDREILAQTGECKSDKVGEKQLGWLPGAARGGVLSDPSLHESLKAADEYGEEMITGVSGSLDLIFTLSLFLGIFDGDNDKKIQFNALIACIGWLCDAKDHSVHEVRMAAKSFGLEYTPSSDSYKKIRPNDSFFIQKLRVAQKEKGYLMPDELKQTLTPS